MKWRVVIVDKSAEFRTLLTYLVTEDSDFEVIDEATDGDEAVSVIDLHQPDIVLLELELPTRDGLSILPEISSVPVVAMSALDVPLLRRAATDAGALGFIGKNPTLPVLLVPYLKHLLGRRAAMGASDVLEAVEASDVDP